MASTAQAEHAEGWRTKAGSGSIMAASAAVLFGTAFVATAVQLRSFEPLPGALWRAVLGGAGLLAILPFVPRGAASPGAPDRPTDGRWGAGRLARIIALGLLSGPFFLAGYNVAIGALGATIGGFVVGCYAVLAAVLGPIVTRDRLEPRALAGFAAALVGTALLSELRIDRLPAAGVAAGFSAAASYAFYLVFGRRWAMPYRLRPEHVSLSGAVLTVVTLLLWLLVTSPGSIVPAAVGSDALIALAWLAITLVAGQTLVMAAVRRIPAQRSAAFLLLNPLTSATLAALLLGEQLSPAQALGAGLVLFGIALATRAWQLLPTRSEAAG